MRRKILRLYDVPSPIDFDFRRFLSTSIEIIEIIETSSPVLMMGDRKGRPYPTAHDCVAGDCDSL